MSALALNAGAERPTAPAGRLATALRYADLPLLAIALAVFVAADLELIGYAITAGAWLATRVFGQLAERNAAERLRAGDRRGALGMVAISRMARIWVVPLAVLVAGLIEEDAGLAAGVLAAALFTVYFSGAMLARMFGPAEESA